MRASSFEKLGVDVNSLYISQPDNGEQALEIAEQLIRSSAIDVLVVDSVAALTPKSEIDGDMGDRNVGLQARLMSQAMRKLTGAIARTKTTCIFINQLRSRGYPPTPSAMLSAMEPVGTTSTSSTISSPIFMMAPRP